MISAVYIADTAGTLVFEDLQLLYAPLFSTLVTKLEPRFGDLRVAAFPPRIDVNDDFYIVTQARGALQILVLSSEKDALVPYTFIDRLVATMEDYFGAPLSPTKVEANSDTLTLLLTEMLDNGLAATTEFNNLRDVISLKGFLHKIITTSTELAAAATNKSMSGVMLPAPKNAAEELVPWRRANVRYTNNEMFVDVVERLDIMLRPEAGRRVSSETPASYSSAFYSVGGISKPSKLVPVSALIRGEIDLLCHVSGVPHLQIQFNGTHTALQTPQFHRCVKLDVWNKRRHLSFVPPDGQCRLMTYEIDLSELPKNRQRTMLGLVELECQHSLGVGNSEFEVRVLVLNHHAVQAIESISVEVVCEEPKEVDLMIRALKTSHGDFRYKGHGRGEWVMKNVATGANPVLRGVTSKPADIEGPIATDGDATDTASKTSARENVVLPSHYNVSFTYKGSVPSGLKVDSLQVVSSQGMSEGVKPYKGVKYLTQAGDYVVRAT